MKPEQQQAVEKAANDLYPYDEWSIPAKGMAAHIITNPSDFGLVSKETMFEFARWIAGYFDLNEGTGMWYKIFGFATDDELTDTQLFEIYKAKTEQP